MDGVHCKSCGLKLSPQEYAEWIGAQKPQNRTTVDKPKRARKKVNADE